MQHVAAGLRSVEVDENGSAVFIDTRESASEHIPTWEDWKTYISNLQEDIIDSTGIVRFTCEFLDNTADPNYVGDPRCVFVVYLSDGGFWRIHRGVKGSDAKLVDFPLVSARDELKELHHLHVAQRTRHLERRDRRRVTRIAHSGLQ